MTQIALLRRDPSSEARVQELMEELRELTPPREKPVARTPLDAARAVADVTRFEIPSSHRKKFGNAVRLAKKALVEGLAPLHAEVLRAQSEFNAELLDVLDQLLRASADESTDRSAQKRLDRRGVEARLGALVDPRRALPSSEGARILVRLHHGYVRVVEPALKPLLERQRRFNTLAVGLTLRACDSQLPDVETANALVAQLAALTDPLAGSRVPMAVRASRPIWAEIFRRQTTFNREAMLVLANLLNGRPPATEPSEADYRSWYEARQPKEIAASAAALASLRDRPLISIVVPAWETPEDVLEACIDSVKAQLYDRWELCIVDDGSKSRRVQRVVERHARRDPRIRFRRLEQNGGIAAATNAAIDLATGEWIAFFDHDDTLAPHALAEMALRIAAEPSLDWLYSDEDRLSADGHHRHTPAFKPDFSPELLRSYNYVCHFVVARAGLVKELKLRRGFEGSQDYDFLLRLSEKSTRVAHVPKVLYHWRASELSLSRDRKKLEAASQAGARALEEHLRRSGEDARVEIRHICEYQVRYPVRGRPLVSIIVPFKDRPELLDQVTRTLFARTAYTNFELLLVSNNSRDPCTFEVLDSLTDPRIRPLEWNHPFNYPAINNFAAREAKGDLLLFLNNDISIEDPNWLDELVSQIQRRDVGAVGCKLRFPDGSVQHAGVVVGICGSAAHPFWRFPDGRLRTPFGHVEWNRDYLAVTSACEIVRRDDFETLGGFDERFQVCGSDVDLGIRIRAMGKRVVYTAGTWLYHHESASRRNVEIPENDFWESIPAYGRYLIDGDPFYNPNLTLSSTDCALRENALSPIERAAQDLLSR